jgi:hypothetical protein
MKQVTEHIETPTAHQIDDHKISPMEQFRVAFRYTRVTVHDGYMNYTTIRKEFAKSIQAEAEEIITRLRLPLKTGLKISPWNAVLTIEPK